MTVAETYTPEQLRNAIDEFRKLVSKVKVSKVWTELIEKTIDSVLFCITTPDEEDTLDLLWPHLVASVESLIFKRCSSDLIALGYRKVTELAEACKCAQTPPDYDPIVPLLDNVYLKLDSLKDGIGNLKCDTENGYVASFRELEGVIFHINMLIAGIRPGAGEIKKENDPYAAEWAARVKQQQEQRRK